MSNMSQPGSSDIPNMMWQDEEAFRRQLPMTSQQQQFHQQQPTNMQYGAQSVAVDSLANHMAAPQPLGNNSLYMANPLQQQTTAEHLYSVLPMGNGNYLKVFHHQDEKFQNYELFSNNTFIPIPQMSGGVGGQLGAAVHGNPSASTSNLGGIQLQQPQSVHLAQAQHHQMFYADVPPTHTNHLAAQSGAHSVGVQEDNGNNRLINKFADNWVPNISGTYSPFGEPAVAPPKPLQPMPPRDPSTSTEQFSFIQPQSVLCAPLAQHPNLNEIPANRVINHIQAQPKPIVSTQSIDCTLKAGADVQLQSGAIISNGSFQQHQAEPFVAQKLSVTPKKPRMVAEVRPMSYSDVLSKNVLIKKDSNSGGSPVGSGAVSGAASSATDAPSSGGGKPAASKSSSKENKGKHAFDHKRGSFVENGATESSGRSNQKNGILYAAKDSKVYTAAAKSSGHGTPTEDRNKSPDNENRFSASNRKKGATPSNRSSSGKPKVATSPNDSSSSSSKKKTSPPSTSDQEFEEESSSPTPNGSQKSQSSNCFLYNICKNDSSKSGASSKKSTKQSASSNASTSNSTVSGGGRSSVSKSERFTAYLHRRQQRSSRQKSGYDLVLKVLETWLELVLRLAVWLYDLVTDVVIMSGGMLWEGSQMAFEYSKHVYEVARKELRQNSGRPTAICKAWLVRFDKRFAVDSKWAVWRRFVKKQPQPAEQVRCGRLPTTGDEAMYSLLNCKGKDAYSILGVAADCSQEQVRKHYKKIAVLVHPDKNKQAGAEEAFKILQRAFELIGEPENRAEYDQSLAEALNAEKACSELNELLTQLQSKIAEAANTIRCSSCGLRHPRRPTGRPHFAARECSSCKIRHTAREGDIWAETTLFGLRWKYLALMEGKVFDITEWANCQKGALSHLQPNSHIVQYRIVLGNQQPNQQQQQQQQSHQQQVNQDRSGKHTASEPSLDEFLDNLYSGQNPLGQNQTTGRRRGGRKN